MTRGSEAFTVGRVIIQQLRSREGVHGEGRAGVRVGVGGAHNRKAYVNSNESCSSSMAACIDGQLPFCCVRRTHTVQCSTMHTRRHLLNQLTHFGAVQPVNKWNKKNIYSYLKRVHYAALILCSLPPLLPLYFLNNRPCNHKANHLQADLCMCSISASLLICVKLL